MIITPANAATVCGASDAAKAASIEYCRQQGRLNDLMAARESSVAGVQATRGLEDTLWLCPIEDRRQQDADSRRGVLDGFSLGSYLQLVDWTSRLSAKAKRVFLMESRRCSIGWARRATFGRQP